LLAGRHVSVIVDCAARAARLHGGSLAILMRLARLRV
jgi:hypothetical protein